MEERYFYVVIEEITAGIKALDISEAERERLYGLVNETINRYEELTNGSLQRQAGLEKLAESERRLADNLGTLKLQGTLALFGVEQLEKVIEEFRKKEQSS